MEARGIFVGNREAVFTLRSTGTFRLRSGPGYIFGRVIHVLGRTLSV